MDSFGQIFTIDAMMALLLIIVLIGVSASGMDIAGNKLHDYYSEQSFQRTVGDTADVLIKTPGNPNNWEELKYNVGVTPGLAELEDGTNRVVKNTLTMDKIIRLKENPELTEKMFPEGMSYSLVIYPTDTTISPISVINKNPSNRASDIYVVNRTVLCDYKLMEVYAHIKMDNYGKYAYTCPHSFLLYNKHQKPDFNAKKPGWICVPFTIKMEDINSKDFYLITDPLALKDDNAAWIINRPDDLTGSMQKFKATPLNINFRISEVLGRDQSAVLVFHVFTSGDPVKSFDVYMIGVPHGTPIQDVRIEYIHPQPAYFVLKAWI